VVYFGSLEHGSEEQLGLFGYIKKKLSTLVAIILTLVIIVVLELVPQYRFLYQNFWSYIIINIGFLYAIIGFALVGVGDGNKEGIPQKPNCSVTFANVRWGEGTDGHGIVFTIRGKKDAAFAPKQITIQLEGDSFWQAVGSGGGAALVTLAKWSFLPLSLCPKYMATNSLLAKEVTFRMTIGIGTKQNGTFGAKHETIRNKLNDLIKAGDPPFSLVFEGDGSLLFVMTITASQLLDTLGKDNSNFQLPFTSPFIEEEKKSRVTDNKTKSTKSKEKDMIYVYKVKDAGGDPTVAQYESSSQDASDPETTVTSD